MAFLGLSYTSVIFTSLVRIQLVNRMGASITNSREWTAMKSDHCYLAVIGFIKEIDCLDCSEPLLMLTISLRNVAKYGIVKVIYL